LIKSPGFINLEELCIEQGEGRATKRKDANDQKEMLTPSEKRLGLWKKKSLPFISEFHDRLLRLLAPVEVSKVHSNQPGSGPSIVNDPGFRL
jgi:hypothetical protein